MASLVERILIHQYHSLYPFLILLIRLLVILLIILLIILLLILLLIIIVILLDVNGNALRLAYYPQANSSSISSSSTGNDGNCFRYGAHTDYQGTVIITSSVASSITITIRIHYSST